MAVSNLYDIMDISQTATQDEIKKTYRKLAKKYHPDLNQNDQTKTEKFKELTNAYEILSDVLKRREYDRSLNRKSDYNNKTDSNYTYSSSSNHKEKASDKSSYAPKEEKKNEYENEKNDYSFNEQYTKRSSQSYNKKQEKNQNNYNFKHEQYNNTSSSNKNNTQGENKFLYRLIKYGLIVSLFIVGINKIYHRDNAKTDKLIEEFAAISQGYKIIATNSWKRNYNDDMNNLTGLEIFFEIIPENMKHGCKNNESVDDLYKCVRNSFGGGCYPYTDNNGESIKIGMGGLNYSICNELLNYNWYNIIGFIRITDKTKCSCADNSCYFEAEFK